MKSAQVTRARGATTMLTLNWRLLVGVLIVMGAQTVTAVSCAAASEAGENRRENANEKEDADWLSVGRASENRFSPLSDINDHTVKRLGLAWHLDLPNEGALQATPLAVDGVLYFSGSRSGVYAVDGRTGRRLWSFDADLAHHSQNTKSVLYGGNHGLAYWQGKIYVGTLDGRLVALEARTGQVAWSADTFETPNMPKRITGAPRNAAER
jgi:quinohemoprotein ethanol dehydrogenase